MAIAVFINDAIAASIAAYVANRDHEIRALERTGVEALQEAYRRKDSFLAVVVHELRNPLSPISAAVQALTVLLPDADPRVQDAIKLIGRQSRHLAHILDDLTDLTGFAQGRLQLARQVVDLAEIIEQSLQACEHLLEARRHRISVSVPRALIVDCDPTRMVQVIVNLLNNAAKYTPPGGEIFVTASRSDDVIEVRVRDTGIGIPPEKVAQVFDLYTRLTPASEQSPDGLGIGLALVKALVALHDGTVDCRSDGLGRGTEFSIRVPAYKGRDPVVHATPPQPRRSPALPDDAGDGVRPTAGP
jgi:signal transduction histidine kinase